MGFNYEMLLVVKPIKHFNHKQNIYIYIYVFPGVDHHPMLSFLGLGGSIPVTIPRPKYDGIANKHDDPGSTHDFKQHMWSYYMLLPIV